MDWSHTETAWSNPSGLRSGPFTFHYDYQRADLKVDGPPFYEISAAAETVYTSSGMAAISALLMSLDRIYSDANLSILPGSYAETLEVIESYLARVRPVYLKRTLDERALVSGRRQALLLDSCTLAAAFEATLATEQPNLDLIIFDTTCFSASSGRIRRTLSWANNLNIPIILVRSHTKLDSLGIEYGRLGSLVFIIPEGLARKQRERFESLSKEVQNAIRLFGGAALPAHFPPYVGAPSYKLLTSSRIAAIIRNARRTSRFFASFLPAAGAELHSAHGLYVLLIPLTELDENETKRLAIELSRDVANQGFPIRHAGSFGFDFAATEWSRSVLQDRYGVRISVPDLPTSIWDQISKEILDQWQSRGLAEKLLLAE